MGDPRPLRKKYQGPRHPWQKQRIEEEKALIKEYGLVNKQEIYRANSKLKNFADIAKRLIAAIGPQADIERQQLLQRLNRLGLLPEGAHLDDVLTLTVKDYLERRLQTRLMRKGLARSARQARQFITHQHVTIGGNIITAPGHVVTREDEGSIVFRPNSALSSEDHPERAKKEVMPVPSEETAEAEKPAEEPKEAEAPAEPEPAEKPSEAKIPAEVKA